MKDGAMTRRGFLNRAALTGTALAMRRASRAAGGQKRPPNVLLIMTDDQGWGDIRSHGNEKIDTPVQDRIAAEGARFDRFYVSPLCAPTRASLLTGRYHLRTGVTGVTGGTETMRSEEVTIAEVLKASGYATGCFGKWHNGRYYPNHPNGQGFDEYVGICQGHWNNYFDTTLEHNGEPLATSGYVADVLTDHALKFIEANKLRPFLCYVPYNTPHSPFQVPDKYFNKYKARGLDDLLACCYGMTENIDDNVGRLLAKLDALGLAGQTIVIFLTDNGPNSPRYNGNMRGKKASVHEGGVRVPLFVRWPGHIRPGTTVKQIASHIDLLPTIIELTGVKMIETLPLDGVGLAGLLAGDDKPRPDRMIFSVRGTGWAGSVRTRKWRAVLEGKPKRKRGARRAAKWQLYDMVADPGQKRDVAAGHPRVVAKLKAAYEKWLKDVSRDGFDIPPVQIGHAGRNQVNLLIQDAANGSKGNNSFLEWTDVRVRPSWKLDVVHPGRYEVAVLYNCPKKDLGAKVRVGVGGGSVEGPVAKPYDRGFVPSPDRVKRREGYEKTWAPLVLGSVDLTRGKTELRIEALSKPGGRIMQLKSVQLRRIGGPAALTGRALKV